MRMLNVILFLAAVAVIFFIGAQSDSPSSAAMKDPNPMKANAEQFSRMQQTDMRFAVK
jgi:hypothetical protein